MFTQRSTCQQSVLSQYCVYVLALTGTTAQYRMNVSEDDDHIKI